MMRSSQWGAGEVRPGMCGGSNHSVAQFPHLLWPGIGSGIMETYSWVLHSPLWHGGDDFTHLPLTLVPQVLFPE